jgi:hypothetical protein
MASVRWGVPDGSDGSEDMVDDRGGVVAGECLVGDEPPIEGGAGEQVDGELDVGGGGEFTTLARLGEGMPEGFAAAFGDLGMEVLEGRFSFRGVDEACHQPGEGLIAQ